MAFLLWAAVCVGAAWARVRPADEVALVQRSWHESDTRMVATRRLEAPSWVTGPFGSCMNSCGTHVKQRVVECRSFWDGKVLPAEGCASRAKPVSVKVCSCDLEPCNAPYSDECIAGEEEGPPENGAMETLGCFELVGNDAALQATGCPNAPLLIEDCMTWTSDTPCRSALPFYSTCSATDAATCSDFCFKRGLDVSGVVEGVECRCGASVLNRLVWHRGDPRAALLFNDGSLTADTSGACPVLVSRYLGFYGTWGLPQDVMNRTLEDEAYVDSVVAGHVVTTEQEENRKRDGNRSWIYNDTNEPIWTRPCFPNNCESGIRGPWHERQVSVLEGMDDLWQDYHIVRFVFMDDVDDVRKEAFRDAVAHWRLHTCIVLIEETTPTTVNHVKVGIFDTEGCWVSGVGEGRTKVNLGWCNSEYYLGTMIHEIGHVLGMNLEQKRADAIHHYHGKGPHLIMHWENVAPEWVDVYRPDYHAYMGSAYDGPGDPHVGYAEYDFDSIMHYPHQNRFDTIPSGIPTGQRTGLSSGDILQALDMYQCKTKSAAPIIPELPTHITISGSCPESPTINGEYIEVAKTSLGVPYFKATGSTNYIYWDAHCDGASTTSGRWIVDNTFVEAAAAFDHDEDKACVYWGRLLGDSTPTPMGINNWMVWCGGWRNISLTFTDTTPATTSTTTIVMTGSRRRRTTTTTTSRTTTTTTEAPPPDSVTVTGACTDSALLDGNYIKQGITSQGKPYYQANGSSMYIYWDAHCDGANATPGRWVIDNTFADPDAASDHDQDGSCFYYARLVRYESFPIGAHEWVVWCGQKWRTVRLTFTDTRLMPFTRRTTSTTSTTSTGASTTTRTVRRWHDIFYPQATTTIVTASNPNGTADSPAGTDGIDGTDGTDGADGAAGPVTTGINGTAVDLMASTVLPGDGKVWVRRFVAVAVTFFGCALIHQCR